MLGLNILIVVIYDDVGSSRPICARKSAKITLELRQIMNPLKIDWNF